MKKKKETVLRKRREKIKPTNTAALDQKRQTPSDQKSQTPSDHKSQAPSNKFTSSRAKHQPTNSYRAVTIVICNDNFGVVGNAKKNDNLRIK